MLHFGRGIFGSDFGTTSFVISKNKIDGFLGTYRRLFEKQGAVDSVEQKEKWFFDGMGKFSALQEQFSKIPGSPLAYWVSDNFVSTFSNNTIEKIAEARKGLSTGDNNRFLRFWYEVQFAKCCFSTDKFLPDYKWYPINKGGDFRKWYGNNEYLINWANDGSEVKNFSGSVIRNPSYYFRESITWTMLSSSCFGVRYSEKGKIFEGAGPSLFTNKDVFYILALLCSCVGNYYIRTFNPTININIGDICNVPFIKDNRANEVEFLAQGNISLSKEDWDSFETSWDFEQHPLI